MGRRHNERGPGDHSPDPTKIASTTTGGTEVIRRVRRGSAPCAEMRFCRDVRPTPGPTLYPIERLRLAREIEALARGYKRIVDLPEEAA